MLNKVERWIFYIFLFSIPFQTRKILYFSGWRFNEWQSISVYGTDILFGILLLFWAYNNRYQVLSIRYYGKRLKSLTLNTKYLILNTNFYLVIFLVISAISIRNSTNIIISSYQWLKLVEFALFYRYLSGYAFKKFDIFNSFVALALSGLFQALIAITQFLKQSSLGLRYLGESVINGDLAGIASFYLPDGGKIIRSYGTLPHPNVLAMFLFLSMFSFYFVYLYSRLHAEHPPLADGWDKFWIISNSVVLFGFFTTFSRTIIFIWFVSFCLRTIIIRSRRHYRLVFGTDEGRKRIKVILISSLAVIVLFGLFYFRESVSRVNIDIRDQAVELRTFYAKEALSHFSLSGIGIGDFVSWLIGRNQFLPAYAYQPVHNIFLLIYSETGLIGAASFIIFLVLLFRDFIIRTGLSKSYHLSILIFACSVLFVGFFDHLFLTLQQGRLIFWFTLALLAYRQD